MNHEGSNEPSNVERPESSKASEPSVQAGSCQNCGAALAGRYCAECGQKDREVRRPFLTISKELFQAAFELDGRAYRSLYFLLTRPGFLSAEFVSGRQASYTPPLRLFLVLSIILFALVSFGNIASDINQDDSGLVLDGEEEISREERIEQLREGLAEDEEIQLVRQVFSELDLPFLSQDANARLGLFLDAQIEVNSVRLMEDPSGFLLGSLDYITVFLLLMMPFLALIQYVLYVFSGRFFIEHFILTLHNHSFVILALLLLLPLGILADMGAAITAPVAEGASILLMLWMVIYLYLSLKRFFGQSHAMTLFKFMLATFSYGIVLSIGLACFFMLTFFLS